MNNKELDVLWQICLAIAERNPEFKPNDREELAAWISDQLEGALGLKTGAMGSAYLAIRK